MTMGNTGKDNRNARKPENYYGSYTLFKKNKSRFYVEKNGHNRDQDNIYIDAEIKIILNHIFIFHHYITNNTYLKNKH